ncbi:MAG: SBBP repeat-containing protein [Chloroflexi bacterium]|nr:SBBP repeat-containing protein [Chloroflexota bacterium]
MRPIQATYGGGLRDAFVSVVSADGSRLLFSTFLGGEDYDEAIGIALNAQGHIVVAGNTLSRGFPMVESLQGMSVPCGFVAEIDPATPSLLFSSCIIDGAVIGKMAADPSGNLVLAGFTTSSDLRLVHPIETQYHGGTCFDIFNYGVGGGPCDDVWVGRFNPQQRDLDFSTYLGGTGHDRANAVAADGAGNIYVAGATNSPDFPTVDAIQPAYGGGTCPDLQDATMSHPCYDAFVTEIAANLSGIVYSTYLGGTGWDEASALAVTPNGEAWVGGLTASMTFPIQHGLQTAYHPGTCTYTTVTYPCPDGFIVKFAASTRTPTPTATATPTSTAVPTARPPTATPQPRAVTFSFDRLQIVNARHQLHRAFRSGDLLYSQSSYTVRNARGRVRVQIAQAYRYWNTVSRLWVAGSHPLTASTQATNGRHVVSLPYRVPALSRAYSAIRITVSIQIAGRTRARTADAQIRR